MRNLWMVISTVACAHLGPMGPAAVSATAPTTTATTTGQASEGRRAFDDAAQLVREERRSGVLDLAQLEGRFRKAAETEPPLVEARYDLALIEELRGEKGAAADDYRKAWEAPSGIAAAGVRLAALRSAAGAVAEADAILAHVAGQQQEPASLATGGARRRGAPVEAIVARAQLARDRGDVDRARVLVREALSKDAASIAARVLLVKLFLDRGEISLARVALMQAKKVLPAGAAVPAALPLAQGEVAEAEGDRTAAAAAYLQAEALEPTSFVARGALARVALASFDYARAESELRALALRLPESAALQVNLGVAYRGLGDLDHAVTSLRTATALDPALAVAWFDLGLVLRDRGDAVGAAEAFRAFLAHKKEAPPAEHPIYALLEECERLSVAWPAGETPAIRAGEGPHR